jgi:tetratricopeptide (TPR) repeat protein
LGGNLDKATKSMEKAVELAGSNVYFQQAAISNLADLYAHSGEFEKANELYMKSLQIDASDLHSLAALGSIAFINDKKPDLARKIFDFVKSKTKSPDILLKYIALAQFEKDSLKLIDLATQFEKVVTVPQYGNMYNKYLIDLYAHILNTPKKMLEIAKIELVNRNTPQTQSWYSYALVKSGKKTLALDNYKKNISGKPLEGLELYYMAKTMDENKNTYQAKAFYEAAYKNRFDLDPSKREELKNY